MTNHDLARAAANQLLDCFDYEEMQAIIRATYAAPMTELERLKRQVEFVKRKKFSTTSRKKSRLAQCPLCRGLGTCVKDITHQDDCPHNEVAT